MDNFDEQVITKFQSLNNSQNSIQSTSLWIITHKTEAKEIVKIWYKEFRKANPKKKLTFLYLANDVIQNGRKKAPQFASVFQAVLTTAFKETAKVGDKKTKDSLIRLIKIWRERSIYKRDFLDKVRSNVNKFLDKEPVELEKTIDPISANEVTQHVSHRDPRIKSRTNVPATPKIPSKPIISPTINPNKDVPIVTPTISNTSLTDDVKLQMQKDRSVSIVKSTDLLKVLEEVQNPPSIDEVTRRTIASFPAEVSDPQSVPKIKYKPEATALLEKVRKADTMLIDYNARLDSEMKHRRELAQLLKGWLVHQNDAIKSIKSRLVTYRGKLEQAKGLREILNNHLSNLPELNLSEQTETDLNPLPTLDELFN